MAADSEASKADAAGKNQPAEHENKTTAPNRNDGFFSMADPDCLGKIKQMGQQRLNMLINDHGGNFYEVPEKIMTEYEDFDCYQNRQDSKEFICKKKEGKVTVALADLNKHMLNFLVPGQVLMIQKAENVEDMLTNDMSDLKKDVRAILQQLTYYKEDHAKMKNAAERSDEVAQSTLKLMKDLQNDFIEAKKEIVKLRRDIFLREQTGRSGLDLNQGPSQNVPNQDQSRGRGGRGRGGRGRGGYEGPKGNWGASDPTKIPHILGGNAAFDPNCSSNRFFKKPAEKTENADLESEMTSGSHAGHVGGAPDPGMYDEEGGKDFVQPNANRRKNPLTKKEMRFNKEVVVHKVKSLKKTEYST
jgi:hypothetical protein